MEQDRVMKTAFGDSMMRGDRMMGTIHGLKHPLFITGSPGSPNRLTTGPSPYPAPSPDLHTSREGSAV